MSHTLRSLIPPDEPLMHKTTLDNGLIINTFPMPWLHEVGVTLMVKAGSRYEHPTKTGIAHFLEHMLFKGTERFSDPVRLHTALESLAADMNAATGVESNAYWMTLPKASLAEGFPIFCEMFTHPAFSDIETERQVILEEMREEENIHGESTNSVVLGSRKLWPDHALAQPILGYPETVKKITREHLHGFLKRYYAGNNMRVAFFGPVEHHQSVDLSQQLANLHQSPPPEIISPETTKDGPHWIAVEDATAQLTLSLFFKSEGFCSSEAKKRSFIRRLLDDGFSSRLQVAVRERKGLAYDLWAADLAYSDAGAFELGASVSPENLLEVVKIFFQELKGVYRTPPSKEEWQRTVFRWQRDLITILDRPSDLLERYVGDAFFHAPQTLMESWSQIASLSKEEITDYAEKQFTLDNLVMVLTGPEAKKHLDKVKQWLLSEVDIA
ncbi:M16 family metallopeptidase [Magnetococcales bacterium HHB-1]